MLERQTVSGRQATVIYFNDKDDPTPVDRQTATRMKVVFDDGDVLFAQKTIVRKNGKSLQAWAINAWDESEHPRDEGGKFTDAGGGGDGDGFENVSPDIGPLSDQTDTGGAVGEKVAAYSPGVKFRGTARSAKAIKDEWAAKSLVKTADEMIAAAPAAQGALVKAGIAAGRKLDGVEFKNPGSKVINQKGIDRLKVKIATRGGVASRISDTARIGFVVAHPQQTEQIAAELAKKFEVALEDWRMTDAGYIDRAITVRMPNGMMAEVQMMDPWTAKAKSKVEHGGGGGHELYDKWRSLNPRADNPAELKEYNDALAAMRKLYGDAMKNYTPEWRATLLTD